MQSIVPFRLTVCGIDELASAGPHRPSHVLSILDPDWPVPEAFGTFGEHEKLELRFHDVIEPLPGMIMPNEDHVKALLAFGQDLMAEPKEDAHLLVHCHAGISRSTASMILILAQACPELQAAEVIEAVFEIRDKAWPNLHMLEIGDRLLGRGGTFPEAAHALYRRQIGLRPNLWTFMHEARRDRELATTTKPSG